MSKQILQLIELLAKEKNLTQEMIFLSLEKALTGAIKKSTQYKDMNVCIYVDRKTGQYSTMRRWVIVEDNDLIDADKELALSYVLDNKDKFGEISVGDVFEDEVESVPLGRVSARTTRSIISQQIKIIERENNVKEYLAKNNGIIIGKVHKFDKGNVVVDCGKIEAIILKNDLIRKEIIRIGETIKGYLDKNNPIFRYGRIQISRTSDDFLRKLFENNVPEISTGKIEIVDIARDPGIRAKVSVFSSDPRIDTKGACIGYRNQRIDNISKELFGERIDIIEYDVDKAKYVINALSPASVQSLIMDEDRKVIDAIVDDDKLGTAIGIDGINVKLASKLTGIIINIYDSEEASTRKSGKDNLLTNKFVDELDIENDVALILVENGFTTLEEIAYVDLGELSSIEYFNDDIAKELQQRAKDKILSKKLLYNDALTSMTNDLSDIAKFSNENLMLLIESGVSTMNDFADLSGEELMEIISIDIDTANKLILKTREKLGYFNDADKE